MTDHEKLELIKKMAVEALEYYGESLDALSVTLDHISTIAGFEETDCHDGKAASQ